MAKYPFDEKFNATVKNLPEYKGEAWRYLIRCPQYMDEPVFEALAEAGYSTETVSTYVNTLLHLPIGELGVLVLMRNPGRTYLDEAADTVTKLAKIESDDTVIDALAYALCHLDVENRSAFLRRAATSPNPNTRFAAAYSLGNLSDDIAIESKIALSRDSDDDTRDWAAFGLHLGLKDEQKGRQDIRDAFFERITDSHDNTRFEAIEGLALCKDSRVIEPLIVALECEEVWETAIKAAKEMAHQALYPSLVALKEWWSCSHETQLLDEAIANCAPRKEE